MLTADERTVLLEKSVNPFAKIWDKSINPPAKVWDTPGPVPPANSRFGFETFLQDLKDPQNGTVPITVLISTIIGVINGAFCALYYKALRFSLDTLWGTIPETFFKPWVHQSLHWTWIPLVVMSLSLAVGTSIHILGDPGDLNFTVKMIHENAYVPLAYIPRMTIASLFSIVGAGSLGPEAPLELICACFGGWVSRTMFQQKFKNLVRRHSLCGMACATAGFFGVPVGGALFALEVNNRLGYEYFEHALWAIYSGSVCIVVFRHLAGLKIGPIWFLTQIARDAKGGKYLKPPFSNQNVTELSSIHTGPPTKLVATLPYANPEDMLVGAALGLFGALLAFIWVRGHKKLVKFLDSNESTKKPIPRALFGGALISCIGLIFPHTLFWGMYELETIAAKMDKVVALPHLWPRGGTRLTELNGPVEALLTGFAKLTTTSITVATGYRGGFIFPFFCAGAAFGRALSEIFPNYPTVILVLCVGAGINTTITRASLATPLIMCALSGEPGTGGPLLAASLCALFATAYLPFMPSQRGRDNLVEAQFHSYIEDDQVIEEDIDRVEIPDKLRILD